MDLANWALQTSPKFTIGVKYQFHLGFDQIRVPEIPITLRPHIYCIEGERERERERERETEKERERERECVCVCVISELSNPTNAFS